LNRAGHHADERGICFLRVIDAMTMDALTTNNPSVEACSGPSGDGPWTEPSTQWIGDIRGYLQVCFPSADGMVCKACKSVRQLRLVLMQSQDPALRRTAAVYALILAAGTVSVAAQSSQLIAQMILATEMVAETCRDPLLDHLCTRLLVLAVKQRGVGVRSLQTRLLAEAHAICSSDAATEI
jgi:hypothetical protein